MSTLQRPHGLPNSRASLTARHPLEPKIMSHAEGDNFSPISYPPEASGHSPSGGYLGELPLEDAIFFLPSRGFKASPPLEPHLRHGTPWSPKLYPMQRMIIFRLIHILQRLRDMSPLEGMLLG